MEPIYSPTVSVVDKIVVFVLLPDSNPNFASVIEPPDFDVKPTFCHSTSYFASVPPNFETVPPY